MFEKITNFSAGKKGLIFILCLSAMIKTGIALCIQEINRDGVLYIYAAQQFSAGHFKEGLSIYPMPLYSLLIAVAHFFIHHWIAAARFISIASMVLALIPLYLLSKDLFDRRAAFWGCLLFAVAPMPNNWAVDVIRDPAFLFFFAWAVYFAQRAIASAKLIFFMLSALFSWISVLLRIEGIIFIPVFFLFILWLCIREPDHRMSLFKGLLVCLVFPLLFIAAFLTVPDHYGFYFNRANELIKEAQNLFRLGFLDNYHQLYEKLKAMEALSYYPGGKQNFGEIARHYIPVIYLIGLMESFIKVLFPFFMIPLFFGLRNSVSKIHGFVLSVVVFYLLMIFYFLIYNDWTIDRPLLSPAFLLFPWIGAGCRYMLEFVKKSSKPGFLIALCGMVFLILPLYKCTEIVRKQDNLIRTSGEWFAKKAEFQKAKVATNDPRVPFYAGMGITDYLVYDEVNSDYPSLEQFAIQKKMDIVILKTSSKNRSRIDIFGSYEKMKEFMGKKNIIVIYGSPEFLKRMNAGKEAAKTSDSGSPGRKGTFRYI